MSAIEYDVVCVGAGFSGLSAAHTLLKANPQLKVCVLEAKDRIGGRTVVQDLKCADVDGNDDVHGWEFGGMWVGGKQYDVLELLKELDMGTYDQNSTGNKCIRLNSDSRVHTYSSDLPSIGIIGTLDLGQVFMRLEKLIKAVGAENPWKHPDAEYYDSITVTELIRKLTFTEKVKELMAVLVRAANGAHPSKMNALYFLASCAAAGSLGEAMVSAQECKIIGGSQAVCKKLVEDYIGKENVRLSTPVTKIEQTEQQITIHTGSGDSIYHAKYAIVALPPQQVLNIEFEPKLPFTKTRIYQLMPIGHLIKIIVTYRKAYWKLKGYSGDIVTTDPREGRQGPITAVLDASSEKGHPALVAFIGGDQATIWADKTFEERRDAVLTGMSEFMSIPELKDPIDYVEKDWAKEKYSGGCPGDFMSTGAMNLYTELRTPFNRLEFAGSESSEVWSGYLSGAVHAGKRAANKVLERMSQVDK